MTRRKSVWSSDQQDIWNGRKKYRNKRKVSRKPHEADDSRRSQKLGKVHVTTALPAPSPKYYTLLFLKYTSWVNLSLSEVLRRIKFHMDVLGLIFKVEIRPSGGIK